MHFDNSKKIAEKRLEKHKEAINQMEKEINAKDF
jgi:ABC-type Fe3+-citrate transport system substrate-binding protein